MRNRSLKVRLRRRSRSNLRGGAFINLRHPTELADGSLRDGYYYIYMPKNLKEIEAARYAKEFRERVEKDKASIDWEAREDKWYNYGNNYPVKDGHVENFEYRDGNRYTGNWTNYLRSGQGKMIYKDGRVLEGFWKDDKFDGYSKPKIQEWITRKPTLEEGLKDELDKILDKPKIHFPVLHGNYDFRCSLRSPAKTKLYETIKTLFYYYINGSPQKCEYANRSYSDLTKNIIPNIHGNKSNSTEHYWKHVFNKHYDEYGIIPWNITPDYSDENNTLKYNNKNNNWRDIPKLFKLLIVCLSEEKRISNILKRILKMEENETFFETGCFLYDIADVLHYFKIENNCNKK